MVDDLSNFIDGIKQASKLHLLNVCQSHTDVQCR